MELKMQNIKALRIFSARTILIFDIFLLAIMFCFSEILLEDELEHLHATYLITQGLVPFRDFFEHHNPLLWGLLAPIITFLPQNTILIIYVTRLLMAVFSTGTIYYIYKIAYSFFGGKTCAILSILIYLSFYPSIYMFFTIKPDTLLYFFFIFGLYYFLLYMQTLQAKPLIICTFALTLSFLFLQTAVFMIIPVAIIALCFLYKNPLQYKNYLRSIPIPMLLCGSFILYLYLTDSIQEYFQLCWLLNSKFYSLLDYKISNMVLPFIPYILLSISAYFYLVLTKKDNIYIRTVALIFFFSILKNIIYPTFSPHYLVPSFLCASLLLGSVLKNLRFPGFKIVKIALFTLFFTNTIIIICTHHHWYNMRTLNSIKPQDTSLSYNKYKIRNIYQAERHYYWFIHEIEAIDNYLFNRKPNYNLTKIVNEEKFKYIFYKKESNILLKNSTDEKLKKIYRQHMLDAEILNDYYMEVNGNYILKNM